MHEVNSESPCERMNNMSFQRRRENRLIICCLAAFTLLLCGRTTKRVTTASASADESSKGQDVGGLPLSDFIAKFSSLYGDNAKNNFVPSDESTQTVELSESQMSAFLEHFQKSQKLLTQPGDYSDAAADDHKKDRRSRGKSNRRKVLYDLSVRAHYNRLLHAEQESRNASSSLEDAVSLDDVIDDSCEYFNDGMTSSFDIREMAKNGESILSRYSHWTFRLCPKKSISQIHLEPSAITDEGDTTNGHSAQTLKLPSKSSISNSIQFLLPTVHELGAYLPPSTPDYTSRIRAAWGPNEDNAARTYGLVEYYMGGDKCQGSRRRQSKVIYEPKCCERRQSPMEEFFENDGQIMVRSASEPEPCRYVLMACKICRADEVGGEETMEAVAEEKSSRVDPSDFSHLLQTFLQSSGSEMGTSGSGAFPPMPPSQIEANKKLLQSMFTHAYDSYFYNAFPASELKPLTCKPGVFDLVKVPALTLIDTLDTLLIMGNYTEFARGVERLRYLDERMKEDFQLKSKPIGNTREGEEGGLFSVNQDVSVFETTIRVLGGLLSAHQMAVAFMANLVPKSGVWDSAGEILNSTTIIVADDETESPGEEDVESNVDGPHKAASLEDGGGSQSCTWEPSPCATAEPGAAEVKECRSDIHTSNKKKKSKNATSSSVSTPTWEYDGFLLELAHDIGKRLLFAFDTDTGIPYGTVNLLHGIPPDETTVASLAGAGTLSLEFELLSRLTGDKSFGKAAKLAARALWVRGSPGLKLFGKHIDTQSGKWKEYLSGIGSNSDSFYEYLIKHYLLFPDDSDFWFMFLEAYSGVHDNSRIGEWYADVDMGSGLNGHVRQVFESLMAFYPGLQVLLGELVPSAKSLNSFFLVREFLGLLPERFNFVHWKSEHDVHPLRPELLESCYFLHLASIGLHGPDRGPCSNSSLPRSQHSSWLWAADFALHTVHKLSWTPCGFATVTKVGPNTSGGLNLVGDHDPRTQQQRMNIQHHNEMPSYFLSETIKYLWLTFDAENNILHKSDLSWIFTTEAHPIHYVPISNSTNHGDDRLNTQLNQVRSLLKERVLDSLPSSDDGFSANASFPSFEHEKWTRLTPEPMFNASIHIAERDIIASKENSAGIHGVESGPPFQGTQFLPAELASYGIFSSEISAINQAHFHFKSYGKGSGNGLGKRCPNYHHSDLQWAHALHGESLDYNTAHSSSVSSATSNSNDGMDRRMVTALASISFYGTDFYADGTHVDKNRSCPVEEDPDHSSDANPATTKSKKIGTIIRRPHTRLNSL